MKSSWKYTQKTLQTESPPASTAQANKTSTGMANEAPARKTLRNTVSDNDAPGCIQDGGRKMEEDSPLSVGILHSELRTYREDLKNDIKTEIEIMHQEIRKDISSSWDEAKADINML